MRRLIRPAAFTAVSVAAIVGFVVAGRLSTERLNVNNVSGWLDRADPVEGPPHGPHGARFWQIESLRLAATRRPPMVAPQSAMRRSSVSLPPERSAFFYWGG